MEFLIPSGARLLGVASTLLMVAWFIWRRATPEPRVALWVSVGMIVAGVLLEYSTLPLTVGFFRPVSLVDLLTFKEVVVSTALISAAYALMIASLCRVLVSRVNPKRGDTV